MRSIYPSPLSEQNLKVIPDIKKDLMFYQIVDHTTGNACALASVVIEARLLKNISICKIKVKQLTLFFLKF